MGALRNTLKLLFNEQNIETLIDELSKCISPSKWSVSSIKKNTYEAAYTNTFSSNTIDQASSAFQIANSRWCKGDGNNTIAYCSRNNIFNILLHYSVQIIYEKGNEPICRFEQLLKWHEVTYSLGEDMFTTSFLASSDIISHKNRLNFSWPLLIDHDNAALHELYRQPMVDIHNHLNGNGYIADLNWLSLMNDVHRRRIQFCDKGLALSKAYHTSYRTDNKSNSLYVNVIKAVAVRIFLFCNVSNQAHLIDYNKLLDIIQEDSILGIGSHLSFLNSIIKTLQKTIGTRYRINHCAEARYIDYAIINQESFLKENGINDINFILSGERYLLYKVFKLIYSDKDNNNILSMLLYIYLIIKNELCQELVQTNDSVGFANFQEYQNRKSAFLKKGSIYSKLLTQTAIRSIIGLDKNDKEESGKKDECRYLETRICPELTSSNLSKQLINLDTYSRTIYKHQNPFGNEPFHNNNEWHYVAHFIKKPDNSKLKANIQNPRNWNVRKTVKQQSYAISHIRKYNSPMAQRLVGIDAASSELCCRPEVFAQAFRFLRNDTSNNSKILYTNKIPELGITYHVGEDYNDIVDGLRATREAVMFLCLKNGDRIGHGLVLGTDVSSYYKKRNYAIPMAKQVILDNMAFMLVEASDLFGFQEISTWLNRQFEVYLNDIYGSKLDNRTITPYTYYQSWLLRGDNPEFYKDINSNPKHFSDNYTAWNRYGLVFNNLQNEARRNENARFLYHLYHFNGTVKDNGNSFDQLEYPKALIPVIEQLQEKILTEIEAKHISIECNPSSNYKIGEMTRFIEHPITRFNMISRPSVGKMHNLCVSINTDDKGVFSTSIEREFALMAAAYDKEYQHDPNTAPTPREVYTWLDNIRKMGIEMKFAKYLLR